jgi:ABC-type antimicrobial peptide transport system permease subunit
MDKHIWKLAIDGMRGERRQAVLRILILYLSFTFIVVTLSVTASVNKTSEEYRYRQYGKWTSAIFDGNENDIDILMEDAYISKIGTATLCGTVKGKSGLDITEIGCMDETLLEMGYFKMQSGHMPETNNEIAMEADILSALGYSYELGQNIVIEIARGSSTIEKSYVLCGVLTEYTNIWVHGDSLLAGAILTQEETASFGKPYNVQYFLYSDKTNASLMASYEKRFTFISNNAILQTLDQQDTYYGALALIFAVTAVAIFAMYFVQMRAKVCSLAMLRSIGATRKQLRKKLFCETILSMLPSGMAGMITGLLLTWTILNRMLSIELEYVCITLPLGLLLAATILWGTTIFLSQLVILQYSYIQPLVGNISTKNHALIHIIRMRYIMLALMGGIFISIIVLSYLKGEPYRNADNSDEELCDYIIRQDNNNYITDDVIQKIENTPGVTDVIAKRSLIASMTFPNMEQSLLLDKHTEWDELMPDIGLNGNNGTETLRVIVYGFRDEDAITFLEETKSPIDIDSFLNGDEVILWFGNGDDELCKITTDTGLEEGDTITLGLYGSGELSETEVNFYDEPKLLNQTTTCIGDIIIQDEDELLGREYFGNRYYTVITSEALIRKMLSDNISSNVMMSSGITASAMQGYESVDVWASTNATYLSTDYAVSEIANKNGLLLSNQREKHEAHRRQMRQNQIYLYLTGACIAEMLLLLMWNILVDAGTANRRKYGILKALGMSERQKYKNIRIHGIVFSITTFLIAIFIIALTERNVDFPAALEISFALSIFLYLFYIMTQKHALKGNPLALIREE